MPRPARSTRHLSAACALIAISVAPPTTLLAQVPTQPFAPYWSAGNQLGNSILNWDPSTDADAAFNRSSVPLAPRIATPYNVNPNARVNQGGVTSLAAFGPMSNNPSQGSPTQRVYAPGHWQYTDTLVAWGGSASEGSILAPTGTVIDAAHRNGTRVLGNVFLPPNAFGGTIGEVNAFLQRRADGSYPVADKMIQAARHYRFDGWFVNQETSGGNVQTAQAMQGFLKYMKAQAPELHTQWYDAMDENGNLGWQGALNNNNDAYFDTDAAPNSGKVSDSMFVDFRWNGSASRLDGSANKAASLGRSRYDLYTGVDMESRGFGIAGDVDTIFGNGGNHRSSLGLYRPEFTFNFSDQADRQSFYAGDARLWVGQNNDPSNTATGEAWKGIANYVPARSVVRGTTFATNFNKGTGTRYMIDGQQLAGGEWNNLGLQDVQPTYQWMVGSTGAKLRPAFSHDDAYNGGTSLNITGTLNATNDIRLYQTEIAVAADSKFKVVLKPTQADPLMKLAVSFTDAPGAYTFIDVPANLTPGQWNAVTLDLGAFAGRTLANVGLRIGDGVVTPIGSYGARLGQFVIYRGAQSAPAAPTAPTIDAETAVSRSGATSPTTPLPLRLRWERSTGTGAGSAYAYNIFRRNPNDSLTFLGATPNDAYFVPAVARVGTENFVTLEFETVGQDFGVSATRTRKSFYVDWARPAQTLTYKSSPTTTGGTGTWGGDGLNWNAGPAAPADQYWSDNWRDTALFTGAPGTVTVTAPVTAAALTFAADGIGLVGPGPLTLRGAGNTPGTITVTSATDTATLGMPLTAPIGVRKAGAGTLALAGNFAANFTLAISAGTLRADNELWIGDGAAGVLAQSAGSVTARDWFAVGRRANGSGTYNLNGGAFVKDGTAGNLILGSLGGRGTFNHNAGTVTVTSGATLLGEGDGGQGTYTLRAGAASLRDVVLSHAGAAAGTFNLDGGTVDASAIRRGNGAGVATFNFNGGTLRPTADSPAFLQNITLAAVKSGGAIVDTNGRAVTINQPLVAAAGSTGGLTKRGAGTLTLGGVNTYAGTTSAEAGTLVVAAIGALPAASAGLIIGTAGRVDLAAPGSNAHDLYTLAIADGGALDVTDDALSINYAVAAAASPVAAIRGYLRSGYDDGSWAGATGIVSSAAAATPAGRRSVGYADDGASVVVRYTYAGDANLDLKVDFADLVTLAQNYGQSGLGWSNGDFGYDAAGSVGFADLVALAQNYGAGTGAIAFYSEAAAAQFAADFAAVAGVFGGVDPASVVPEPSALALLAVGSIAGRRRRRAAAGGVRP